MEKKEIQAQIEILSTKIKSSKKEISLFYTRAGLYTNLQEHSNAINDYIAILELDSNYKDVKVKLDMLKTITKYVNTDIYASTNTNMDPWME